MTDPAPGRRLLVDADLNLSIDGVDATLVGRGDELTLHTDQPVRLWRALRRSGLPGALRPLGQQVAASGTEALTLTIEGPHGAVARTVVGARDASRRASPGRPKLQWYRPQNLVPAAAGWAGAAALGLVIALVVLWSRRSPMQDH